MRIDSRIITEWRQCIFVSKGNWALLACCLAFIISMSGRGFGFGDESYYVAWISDPLQYKASIHPFGLPLHIVYKLTGESIVFMRMLGALLLALTGAVLGLFAARHFQDVLPQETRANLVPLGALFSLSYYALWVLTPSYNLLANAGAALITAGCLTWMNPGIRRSLREDWIASTLVGLGGLLAAFGKPTFAVLAACYAGYLLLRGCRDVGPRRVLSCAAIATATSVVPLVLVLALVGGPTVNIAMVRQGMEVLRFGNSIGNLPWKTATDIYHSPVIFLLTVAVFVVAIIAKPREGTVATKWFGRAVGALLAADLFYFCFQIARGVAGDNDPYSAGFGVPVICVVLALIAYTVVKQGPLKGQAHNAGLIKVIAILLILPFAIAFGTANSLVHQSVLSLFAPLLAAVIVAASLMPVSKGRIVQVTLALLVPLLLLWSAQRPYGLQASIWKQAQAVTLPFNGEVLKVDEGSALYIESLKSLARRTALSRSTPIVDLSAGGPGTALLLNGGAPYYPWLVHIFEASPAVVEAAWNSMSPSEQDAAWIVGPVHPRFLGTTPARLLAKDGARYRKLGRLPMTKELAVEIFAPMDSKRNDAPASR